MIRLAQSRSRLSNDKIIEQIEPKRGNITCACSAGSKTRRTEAGRWVKQNMKMRILAIIIAITSVDAFAKAKFYSKPDMIEQADAIALVEIVKVEKVEKPSAIWTYRQKATAKVIRSLKGQLEQVIEIYGDESFICAQCRYNLGKFILFLRKHDDFWVGCNWHLGIRPITDGSVKWFADDKNKHEMIDQPLETVLLEIESILKSKDTQPAPPAGRVEAPRP